MDLTPYVERLRADLAQTIAAADAPTRTAAERLGQALDPALRLAFMEALSEAAAEITSHLHASTVETRLHGREIDFVVTEPAADATAATAEPGPADGDCDDEGDLVRITVRVPESIKTRAEELASRTSHSLNTWIVNALRRATREDATDIDSPSIPFAGRTPSPRRMTGWI